VRPAMPRQAMFGNSVFATSTTEGAAWCEIDGSARLRLASTTALPLARGTMQPRGTHVEDALVKAWMAGETAPQSGRVMAHGSPVIVSMAAMDVRVSRGAASHWSPSTWHVAEQLSPDSPTNHA